MPELVLKILDQDFTIHRFQHDRKIPEAVFDSSFYWIGRTDDELSVVCDSSIELPGGELSEGWACFKVLGPIDFSETGILAGLSTALASADISIFAISTFDTDYILLPSALLQKAVNALVASGYQVQFPSSGKIAKHKSD